MEYTELELDALRELANIGSGTAGTALSSLLGRPVDVSVPRALALPLADAVESAGDPESPATGVVLPLQGDLEGTVVLMFDEKDAATLCSLLDVEPDSEVGRSALGEIGNILGTSYIQALGQMTGLTLEPTPPQVVVDMLGAMVATVLATTAETADVALVLDSDLAVEGAPCSLSFMLLPEPGGVRELLTRLGL